MAIDTEQKRSMVLNASHEWGDITIPKPDGNIEDIDQVHLLHGYFLFEQYQGDSRHRLALLRLFPVKGLITDE
jgi:hypothetical protein